MFRVPYGIPEIKNGLLCARQVLPAVLFSSLCSSFHFYFGRPHRQWLRSLLSLHLGITPSGAWCGMPAIKSGSVSFKVSVSPIILSLQLQEHFFNLNVSINVFTLKFLNALCEFSPVPYSTDIISEKAVRLFGSYYIIGINFKVFILVFIKGRWYFLSEQDWRCLFY